MKLPSFETMTQRV